MLSTRTTVAWVAVLCIAVETATGSSPVAAATNGRPATAGRIAYATYELTADSPSGATQNVYSSTPTGADTRLIARHATAPVWSPDGKWLAYVRSYAQIWRVRADGSTAQRVSRPGWGASEPTWSPTGKRLAYTRTWEVMVDGYPESRSAVYVVRRDGKGTRKLHSGSGASWSPDGRVIAFNYQGSLAVIGAGGRHLRVLREGIRPLQLHFAPASRQLVFFDVPLPSGASVMRIFDMSTRRVRTVPEDPSGEQPQAVTWTPDGRRIAYLRNHWVTENGITHVDAVELCTVRPDGSNRRQLATLRPEVMSWDALSWAP